MLGACYLTEWTEGLDQMYDLQKEVWTYKSSEELVEKSKILMNDRNLRRMLKNGGQLRAMKEHSIINTLYQTEKFFGKS